MVKWEFYFALTEEFLSYIYDDEKNTRSEDILKTGTIHKALAVTKSFVKIYPDFDICHI